MTSKHNRSGYGSSEYGSSGHGSSGYGDDSTVGEYVVVDDFADDASDGADFGDGDYGDGDYGDGDFEEYFDESDFDEETDFEDGQPVATGPVPVVAVVGRPNVGKSTLVNRVLGRRQAVVEDVPGVTRDRVAYDAQWSGRRFTIVDTGGWEPDARDRAAAIAAQAEVAANTADVILFVVDSTVGALDEDEAA
ncbi:MAG TPA: GTPase, partial [Micromonosporaceae bacterium]